MRRRLASLAIGLLVGLALWIGNTPAAYAHGERAQEAFLKMKTAAFFDVKFTTDHVKQGEPVTITGTVKILETWPKTLAEPEVGFLGVAAPGPKLFMTERTVNGVPTPGSVFIKKGGTYDFKIVLEGREVGRWHIHPIIAVQGSGALIGPGEWITVDAVPGYTKSLTLLDGQTVDFESYGKWFVIGLSVLGFALGVWWMIYWTWSKPTVTRLAVTNHLALNDDGSGVGMITKKDHRFVNLVAAITVVFLAGGWAYSAQAYPTRIPQQVIRFQPPALADEPVLAKAEAKAARFNVDTDTLTLDVQVTNVSTKPIQLADFTTAAFKFANQASGVKADHVLTVQPDGAIAPGETKTLKVTMADSIWTSDRLMPLRESQMDVAGVLTFTAGGQSQRVTIQSGLIPSRF